jgi:hypothetical protein
MNEYGQEDSGGEESRRNSESQEFPSRFKCFGRSTLLNKKTENLEERHYRSPWSEQDSLPRWANWITELINRIRILQIGNKVKWFRELPKQSSRKISQ